MVVFRINTIVTAHTAFKCSEHRLKGLTFIPHVKYIRSLVNGLSYPTAENIEKAYMTILPQFHSAILPLLLLHVSNHKRQWFLFPGSASWKEPIPLLEIKASSCGKSVSAEKKNLASLETYHELFPYCWSYMPFSQIIQSMNETAI